MYPSHSGHEVTFAGSAGTWHFLMFGFSELVASMVGIFVLAVLYEGLKTFRQYLSQRMCYCRQRDELMHSCPCTDEANEPRDHGPRSPAVRFVAPKYSWR